MIKKMNSSKKQAGFTMLELLVVIGIISVLFAIVLIAVNPARQFKKSRDANRRNDVRALLNAVWQYGIDNKGLVTGLGTFTDCTSGYGDINSLDTDSLAPLYIASIPTDPNDASSYEICTSSNGRVKVHSTGEIDTDISVTR